MGDTSESIPAAGARLAPALAALAQSGVGIAVAAVIDGRAPIVGLGQSCTVQGDGRLRVLVDGVANRALVAAVAGGSPVAVTFTATRDHSSFQVKAGAARVLPATSDDLPVADRQAVLFRDGLVELGFTPVQAAGYTAFAAADLVAIEFRPDRIFSQTPGPGAGREVGREVGR